MTYKDRLLSIGHRLAANRTPENEKLLERLVIRAYRHDYGYPPREQIIHMIVR